MGFDFAAAVGSIAAPIIGGIIGNAEAAGDRGDARNAANLALAEIQKLNAPPDLARAILLKHFQSAGILTPEMESQVNAGFSKAQGITDDPALKDAQMGALHSLTQRSKGGLTPEDRAALNQQRTQVNQDTEAKRQQIAQNMQAKGLGGSGSDLASQLMASQSGANSEAANSDRLMAMASQNALQAASASGQLGGQIRSQDFGENMQKSQAEDEMQRFNVNNQIAQQARNVQTSNSAQAANLQNAQNISNSNINMDNGELLRQRAAQQQDYQNALNLAAVKSGAYQNQSNYLQQQGDKTAQSYANMGSGAGAGMGALSQAYSGNAKPKVQGQSADNASIAQGGSVFAYDGGEIKDFRSGGKVPGQAQYEGDHPANDTVRANVSPGEIVIPRTMAKSPIGDKILKLLKAHQELHSEISDKKV